MTDLAKKAARLIVDSREDWDSENEALCDVQDHIEGVGVLISHERLAELNAYEAELQAVRNILQNVHPMGTAKHIGLRESATALAEVVEKQVVSHEDAALLRQVRRALARVDKLTIELLRTGEFRVEVISEHELRRAVEIDADATASLKSALDAAGVPDAKGT